MDFHADLHPKETIPMTENLPHQDISDRLQLIESMIAEGRRSTRRWAWAFLLWGVAYYVAIGWSVWGKSPWAWPVTMVGTAVVTGITASRFRRDQPCTSMGRVIGAVWRVMGIVLFVVLMAVGWSGRADLHMIVAIAGAMLAMANGISSIVLRWKMQFVCALAWLATAVAACYTTDTQIAVISLAAIFLCQIVFGIYGIMVESRGRRGVVHA
jgi:hypothetical protein